MAGLPRSWTRRAFERSGLPTVWAGMLLLGSLLLAFALQELVLGRFSLAREAPEMGPDMWIAVAHIVIAAYLVTATVYCEQSREASIERLRPLLDEPRARPLLEPRRSDRLVLAFAGPVGIVVAFLVSLYLAPTANYDPRTFTSEILWHRVLGLTLGFWTARLSALIILESGRFSDLARSLREIDLLDLAGLTLFVRQGLTSALLVIGSVSVFALFLVDSGYLAMVAALFVTTSIVGGFAMLLPLRGVRERIRAAKQDELAWCRDRMRRARAALAAGDGTSGGDLEELIAWETRIAAVNEWAIDTSTFVRFVLYLLIPLGSWAGGALVERVVDTVLD